MIRIASTTQICDEQRGDFPGPGNHVTCGYVSIFATLPQSEPSRMPPRASLNVSLTPELTAYIGEQVASGRYRSASEVVRASLRLLQRDEPAGLRPSSLEPSVSFDVDHGVLPPEGHRPR
jgi:antitoxin ParD1/3/4